jgi:hypothetical protein
MADARPDRATARMTRLLTQSVLLSGSIPVTLSFADALNINVLLLPMGRGDDGAHSCVSRVAAFSCTILTHLIPSSQNEREARH